jgi:hypothetical protein
MIGLNCSHDRALNQTGKEKILQECQKDMEKAANLAKQVLTESP